MDLQKFVLVPSQSEKNAMEVSYPKNDANHDKLKFPATEPMDDNVFVHNGDSVTEPIIPTKAMKEVTLNDVMDAIKMLNNRLDCMELCSRDMIKGYIKELQATAVQSPNDSYKDRSLDSSSGYSPENVAGKFLNDTVQKTTAANREKTVNIGMEKLKNFGTITISDTDEETAKQKKRTLSKETFVRTEQEKKRQNTKPPRAHTVDGKNSRGKEPEENSNKPFNSDYRRGVNEQGSKQTFAAIPRRLTFTQGECSNPKASLGQGKKLGCSPKSVTVKKRSPVGKYKGGVPIGRTHAFRNSTGLVVPKHFKCAFKTTTDMKLDHIEIRVCAYVFQSDFDARDVVFQVGKNDFSRADFECMCPGMLVSREFILMTALRATCRQHTALSKTLWCLPPSFADDVANGNTAEDLHEYYNRDWMGRYDRLSLIYVPIEDSRGHWYLMVISTENRKIYHLDTHLREDFVEERQRTIRNISVALTKVVDIVYDGFVTFCGLADFDCWDIVEARGVPNCGNSDNSALWVAEWLNMQNAFSNNICGVMDEKITRMMVALRILMGNHNQASNELIRKAREFWTLMTRDEETA